MDPHEVLGVAPDATAAEVRDAYRTLVRRHHPDRHIGEPAYVRAAEAARMAEVTGAFTLLNDPVALARHHARTTRIGRAPAGSGHGVDEPGQRGRSASASSPPPDRADHFDYRRAARAEFDDDPVGGRWGRTPPPRPAPTTTPRTRTRGGRRTRRTRSAGRRGGTVLGWLVVIALVVGTWLVASDSGQTVWAILRGVVDTREASSTSAQVDDSARGPGSVADVPRRVVDDLQVDARSSSSSRAVGDCIDVVVGVGDAVLGLDQRDCTERHEAEVIGRVVLAGAATDNHPGNESIMEELTSAWGTAFERIVRGASPRPLLGQRFAFPSPDSWGTGDRIGLCLVDRRDGAMLQRPLRELATDA